ncbi:MAG TPA: flagellar hook-associated protein FlgK [Firmicutes bacterium]|nr:flagellar hook-associated protein FlgK [Bacillota bacterium]
MRPTFIGLETMRRALQAHQKALDVTGHNIANAATPGYTRQQVELSATRPYTPPGIVRLARPGQIGTGVEAARVRRVFDGFIENRIRLAKSALGRWDQLKAAIEEVDATFNDPSDVGLGDAFSRFWNAWQELSKRPDSLAARAVLIEEADGFCAILNRASKRLNDLILDLESSLSAKVDEVNSLSREIAELNGEIAKIKITGNEPNDLMDKRDIAIARLAELVNISTFEEKDGSINVQIGGVDLVRRNNAHGIELKPGSTLASSTVVWEKDGASVNITAGEIAGIIEARDQVVPKYLGRLDEIAGKVIEKVNGLHDDGYGLDDLGPTPPGRIFFDGTNAGNIKVSDELKADPRKIAAAESPGAPGDGAVAKKIAELKDELTMGGGTLTFTGYYSETITILGNEGQTAERMSDIEKLALQQHTNRKESFSGVSVDEELANMMKYQHAYDAAARMVTTIDEMLDTIINRTGIVGR